MRLSADLWMQEVDKACLLGYIYELMEKATDQFPPDALKKVYLGMVEGRLGFIDLTCAPRGFTCYSGLL